MSSLTVNEKLVNSQNAKELIDLCPFGAISYENGKLQISSACKMCKLCVKKSGGIIQLNEEKAKEVDKSLWRGILVYADCSDEGIHRVTYELLGKANELKKVIPGQ